MTQQEASAPAGSRSTEEPPLVDGTKRPPAALSGLLGNNEPKQLLAAGDVSTSRQSFHLAVGNPSDFFVDVM